MGFWSFLHRSRDDDAGPSLLRRPRIVSSSIASKWQVERRRRQYEKKKQSQPSSEAASVSVEEIPHIVLWEKAAQLARDSDKLTKKERAFLDSQTQHDSASDSDSPLIDAIQAANDAKKTLQDGKLAFTTRSGQRVAVQERFESLISGLETYTDMVDTLASTSEYASLVWGVAKFFFQILWNKLDILDRLQEVLAKVVMTMAVCQVYESIYTERVQLVQLQIDKEAAKTMAVRMGTALPELHAAILVFAIKARTYFQDAQTVVGAVTTAIKPFDAQFKPYVDKISEEQQAIQQLAELADMVITQESTQRIEKMQSDMNIIRDLLAPLEKKLNSIHNDVQDAKKGITALQEVHALEWLNAVDQRHIFQMHQEQRVPGTCQWILQTPEYTQWKDAAFSTPSLWICGEAGTGKTILASFIAQELVQSQEAHVLTVQCGHFGRGVNNLSATDALSGLILQLLHLARDLDRDQSQEPVWGPLMEHLQSTVQRRAGFANRGKTVRALQDLLTEMLTIFSRCSQGPKRVVVLLDALDACSDPDALVGSPNSPLGHTTALIVTSRDTVKTTTFQVPMRIEEDLGVVVDARIASEDKLAGHREAILHIVQQTKNTLRFANILLDDLASQSPDAVTASLINMERSLDALPSASGGPSALHRDPFLRAAGLGNHLSLQLLLDESPRPFSPQQVMQAVLCASMHGHDRAVRILLAYRGTDTQATQPVVAAVASELLAQSVQRGDADLVGQLIQQPYVDPNDRNDKGQTPLTVAAKDGRADVVRTLLAHPVVEVNAQEDTEDTPLIWAAYNGHTACARLLLAHPAIDPNILNNYYDAALTYAMRYAFVDIVRLLVSHPAIDLDVASPHPKAPIHEAVLRAPRGAITCACLQLLVDAGADVNKRRGEHDTTLALAAERGYDDLVAVLLTSPRLDWGCRNAAGETPLMTAQRLGHDKVVALLE